MKKVLITGATGSTGKNAIKKLLELRVPIRALVHKKDARSELLSTQGVEIVEGDLSDFDSVSAALKGIGGAYFMYPIQVPGILEGTAFFAQAAIDEGVGFIVNMSQMAARRVAKSHAAQGHWIAERLFDRSGISVAHLRPTFFAEWLMYVAKFIKLQSQLILPFGDAHYAPIAAEDLGRVVASIFLFWPIPWTMPDNSIRCSVLKNSARLKSLESFPTFSEEKSLTFLWKSKRLRRC